MDWPSGREVPGRERQFQGCFRFFSSYASRFAEVKMGNQPAKGVQRLLLAWRWQWPFVYLFIYFSVCALPEQQEQPTQ
ncbi:hypothetical protein [Herbaspirillum rubrisubalbicans]|uniref:hypothetical protein n=1 Tax=Herbaspirillum rubrisubalbicans TaxID=80842 RepID=UPI0011BDAF44|nr:hypothetical protein [Herbaspirillum rubrisubalbicans]MCP1576775.1 hypothetical protein [Herbaspirillum rubrisubalbicans]